MRCRSLSVAVGAALLLTACGGHPLDGKTGPQVATAAADALQKAGAVHVTGTVAQDGEAGKVDLQLQGKDTVGTLTFNGAEVQLLTVDGTSYLQGAPEFWSSLGLPDKDTAQFEGRWVTVPDQQQAVFEHFSLAGFVDQLRHPSSDVKDDVTSDEVDGDRVVILEQGDGSTLTVADEEKPYPLQVADKVADKGGTPSKLTFSRFGKKQDISAPSDPLDLTEILGG
jgi:hypothetical protein